jgi:hypothetical protein
MTCDIATNYEYSTQQLRRHQRLRRRNLGTTISQNARHADVNHVGVAASLTRAQIINQRAKAVALLHHANHDPPHHAIVAEAGDVPAKVDFEIGGPVFVLRITMVEGIIVAMCKSEGCVRGI